MGIVGIVSDFDCPPATTLAIENAKNFLDMCPTYAALSSCISPLGETGGVEDRISITGITPYNHQARRDFPPGPETRVGVSGQAGVPADCSRRVAGKARRSFNVNISIRSYLGILWYVNDSIIVYSLFVLFQALEMSNTYKQVS